MSEKSIGAGADATDTAVDTAKTGAKVGTGVTLALIFTGLVGGGLYLKYRDEKERYEEEKRNRVNYTDVTHWFFPPGSRNERKYRR